jgi:ankyrin repeat protein
MADLFIVKERLKLSLKLVGVAFIGGLLSTWYFLGQLKVGGEERSLYLSATVTGALALAWIGLLVFFLSAKRVVDPGHHNPGALDRFPWWTVKILLLAVLLAAGGYALQRYSHQMEGEFGLLRADELAMLRTRIQMEPTLLEKPEGKGGATLAQVAFRENHPEALAMLLEQGASPEGLDSQGRNALVASLDNLPMLDVLLAAGFDPDKPDAEGTPPIHYAVSLRMGEALAMLLEAGAKIDARDAGFRTPLMRAIEDDDLETASTLLEKGAQANAFDKRGDTALHTAVRRRNAAAIRLLLDHKADPRIFNFSHMTPIHIAALAGQNDLLSIFLEQPGLTGLRDEQDLTPLDYAIKEHRFETANLLIAAGADIDRILANGSTLLHQAILSRDYTTARFLIAANANVRIPDAKGETAFDILRRKQLSGLIDLVDQRDHPEAYTNVVEVAEEP